MNFAFDLEVYKEGDFATVYSYRKADAEQSELDHFLSHPDVREASDFAPLVARIQDGLHHLGFNHRNARYEGGITGWFRDESDFRDEDDIAEALWAPIPREDLQNLTPPYPSLRLYCFRIEQMLIVGSGGVKTTQNPNDDPVLKQALHDVKYVMERVLRRLEWEKDLRITEEGFLLTGNKHFEPDHDYPT